MKSNEYHWIHWKGDFYPLIFRAIPGEQENFSYDPTGNWTNYQRAENGTEVLDQSRVNNQDNQVTQIDGSSDAIAYDKAGNATKLPPGADGDWSKHFQLKWDGWNRLVEIRDENGVLVAAYAYDGMFRRTTKAVGAETRSYYYNDQWKCVEERSTVSPSSSSSSSSANANSSSSSSNANSPSSSGSSLVVVTSGEAEIQYVWGARPNHRDELILRDRDTSGNGVLDERLYCLMDYYDPTSIVDTNGDVVERYRFSAFGVRTVYSPTWVEQNESSFDFDFGFHGQFLDAESGYYDYGYRYYSPELGRWTARDPIEEWWGYNLYGFIRNQVPNSHDLYGLLDGPNSIGIGLFGELSIILKFNISFSVFLSEPENCESILDWRIGVLGSITPLTGVATSISAEGGAMISWSNAHSLQELEGGGFQANGNITPVLEGPLIGYDAAHIGPGHDLLHQVTVGLEAEAVPLFAEVGAGYEYHKAIVDTSPREYFEEVVSNVEKAARRLRGIIRPLLRR